MYTNLLCFIIPEGTSGPQTREKYSNRITPLQFVLFYTLFTNRKEITEMNQDEKVYIRPSLSHAHRDAEKVYICPSLSHAHRDAKVVKMIEK